MQRVNLHFYHYLYDFNIFNRETISIEGVPGSDGDKEVALLITDLSEELREMLRVLPDLLNAALGNGLFDQDSRSEGFKVHAVHLEPAYNRYTEKVGSLHYLLN
jgi:hypothetical protein